MRIKNKKLIISLLDTVEKALEYITNNYEKIDINKQLLSDCLLAFENIFEEIKVENNIDYINKNIIECILLIKRQLEDDKIFLASILDIFNQNQKILELINDIKVKIEIVFLPYKYSMWDSMKSIWENAVIDENCVCHLVPIPYYDRKTGQETYEIDMFPPEAESLYEYIVENERPDIIYIHNPYDEINIVTTVHPRFYSSKLREYTDMLVYVPYYIAGHTSSYESMKDMCQNPGCIYADRIILQSENLKKCFLANGVPNDKLLVLGSPKIDSIINIGDSNEVPLEWETMFSGKKVILINTSINGILGVKEYLVNIENIITQLSAYKNIGYIWRPHPLLEVTINAMRPQEKNNYNNLYSMIDRSNNGVIDKSNDIFPAIQVSDGLISDYSSLLMQYTFTGKPALSLSSKQSSRQLIVLCDYFDNYFYDDGVTVSNFIEMILDEKDVRKEERLKNAKKSICNSDGTSGKSIYEYIIAEYNEKEM